MYRNILLGIAALCSFYVLNAQESPAVKLTLYPDKELGRINPDMYGVFFEDINFGADGGLYAELIKNRSFDFPHPLTGWTPFGDIKVLSGEPCFERNPNYVRMRLEEGSYTGSGLDNGGFTGIGFMQGAEYRLTFHARVLQGGKAVMRFECVTSRNDNPHKVDVEVNGGEWKRYEAVLTSGFTDAHSRLRVRLVSEGSMVDVDHISLFPVDTWQGRSNGMRRDLAQALYDLRPGVLRFPGGCIIEGTTLENRYQWKNTVGPVENRPLNINRWNYTFGNKFFPDYFQTCGLGFFEYFQLCEDLGAEPLPVLSCGIACQYQSGELVCLDELRPYIDDALDLIEFANGNPSTEWGSVRAEMGHPEPFGMKYIGIGNEQWGEVYPERLELFVKAIRERYPEMQIVGSSGPSADGREFDYLWPEMKRLGVELVDEHYYKPPEWFFENAGRYDNYDRRGPKVFAGEYAAHDHPRGKANNFYSALAEAAFMTGLERNADVVRLSTYAPLLAHTEAWQWNPDLIWFDNLNVMLTPNYYVQQLYGQNAGTHVIRVSADVSDLKGGGGLYGTAVLDKNTSEVIVKLVNAGDGRREFRVNIEGKRWRFEGVAEATVIHSDDLYAVNEIGDERITPSEGHCNIEDNVLVFTAEPYSFNVIRVGYKR